MSSTKTGTLSAYLAARRARIAERRAKIARMPWHRRLMSEWVMPLAMVLAVMLPVRASLADWNDVPSGSMRPTILEGDRIYVNKLAFGLRVPFTHTWLARWSVPARGDIVTFASPIDGTRLVKRVVAVPGDHVQIVGNRLMVNGEKAEYTITDEHALGTLPGGRPVPTVLASEKIAGVEHAIAVTPSVRMPRVGDVDVVIPEGEFFVLGDNRDMSNDSRFIGTIPLKTIYGRSAYVALSLDPFKSYAPRWDRFFSAMK